MNKYLRQKINQNTNRRIGLALRLFRRLEFFEFYSSHAVVDDSLMVNILKVNLLKII